MTLRVRIALWVAALLIAVLLVFGIGFYVSMARGLRAAIDDSLRLSASQAAAVIDVENGLIDISDSFPNEGAVAELRARGLTIRLLDPFGQLVQAFGPYRGLPVSAGSLAVAGSRQSTFETLYTTSDQDPVRFFTTPVLQDGALIGLLQVAQSLEPVQETIERLLTTLLVGAPLLALAAGLGGYYLAGRALAPVDHITRTAQRISAEDLSARLELPATDDEVGRLAATFDDMLARLEESFRRERQFTLDASHELRTPLTAMQAILGVIGAQRRTPEEYEAALADLADETRRLQSLAENLLLLARGETYLSADPEPVDLSTLLNDLADALRPLAASKGLALDCHLAGGLVASGSYDHLIRLFVNLLDNALKFTQVGGVTVSGGKVDGSLWVEIADTGPGIPPEHLGRIFDRFYQVDAARATAGAGLGLAIAYEIVRAHGGKIEVSSQVGKGAAFRVILPGPLTGRK